MGCESNLRHWIILIFFSMKIKHFHRSWVYNECNHYRQYFPVFPLYGIQYAEAGRESPTLYSFMPAWSTICH
ncbi:MAG: hypothetical protein LC437_05025, partial [Thiohalomonas sp.]|nr:hypothetical protein [Thiohalomonas sp.]